MLSFLKEKVRSSKKLAYLREFALHPTYWGEYLRPATSQWAKNYYSFAKAIHFREYNNRKKLVSCLNDSYHYHIDPDKGFGQLDLSNDDVMRRCIERCNNIVKNVDFISMAASAKKPFLLNVMINLFSEQNKSVLDLACDGNILGPVSRYIGALPLLYRAEIWYSPNEFFMDRRSQMYHLDKEDFRQMKCFIPLQEVTLENGPLTVLPAKESKKIYNKLLKEKKIGGTGPKISDELIYSHSDIKSGFPLTGGAGNVLFADTCNCYHFGSRLSPKPRLLLMIHYASAFCIMVPTFFRKYRDNFGDENLSEFSDINYKIKHYVLGLQAKLRAGKDIVV